MASLRDSVVATLRLGLRQSAEDLVIAGLVMAPFALTLGVLAGWITWAPAPVLILFTLAAGAVATVWNAGWRAAEDAA